MSIIEDEVYKRISAIQLMMEGYLPADFVPPSHIHNIMETVSSHLKFHSPFFEIVQKDISYYYHVKDV